MTSLVIACDPGLSGAIAILDAASHRLLEVLDMPVDRITVGKTVRGRVSAAALLGMIQGMKGHIFLERPEIRPMNVRDKATGAVTAARMGAMGAFMFGEGYGIVYCAAIATGLALTEVRPAVWKRAMGISGEKDESRRRCTELFPEFSDLFRRKADNGRSDAALLALYGSKMLAPSER